MSILFINGSPNKNGNTAALAAELLKDHEYETLNLTDYTTKENRIIRLMANRGYSREKCEDIIGRQASEEEYRALCDRVIDNNGDESDIKRQLKEILDHEIC